MAHLIKNKLINSLIDRELARSARKFAQGRLVDIGCGEKQYASIFEGFVSEHVGVDHSGSPHSGRNVDVVATAYKIPLDDMTFDTALCTSVLEHLEQPEIALRECHRLLRVGGYAIYLVPFIWHPHEEPRDFYRFSSHGLRYLFERTGFEVVELRAVCGFWATFGQLLVYNLYRFNRGPLRTLRVVAGLGLAVQGVAYVMDQVDKAEDWTALYLLVARKNLVP